MIRAFDRAGNLREVTVQFAVDLTPPTISIETPKEGAVIATSSAAIRWSRSDGGSGVASCAVAVDRQVFVAVGMETAYELRNLQDGNHEVRVACMDAAGNSGEALVHFMVETSPLSPSGPYGPTQLVALAVLSLVLLMVGIRAVRRRKPRQPRRSERGRPPVDERDSRP